jgi:radical SAM superfamily enzyme YgiQ (UPF0313 family)
MTHDEIIEMARQAGLDPDLWNYTDAFERFAKLVAEHAKAEEREACAKIAETPIGEYEVVVACGTEPTLRRIPKYLNWQDIVKAIRARGEASIRGQA